MRGFKSHKQARIFLSGACISYVIVLLFDIQCNTNMTNGQLL